MDFFEKLVQTGHILSQNEHLHRLFRLQFWGEFVTPLPLSMDPKLRAPALSPLPLLSTGL